MTVVNEVKFVKKCLFYFGTSGGAGTYVYDFQNDCVSSLQTSSWPSQMSSRISILYPSCLMDRTTSKFNSPSLTLASTFYPVQAIRETLLCPGSSPRQMLKPVWKLNSIKQGWFCQQNSFPFPVGGATTSECNVSATDRIQGVTSSDLTTVTGSCTVAMTQTECLSTSTDFLCVLVQPGGGDCTFTMTNSNPLDSANLYCTDATVFKSCTTGQKNNRNYFALSMS